MKLCHLLIVLVAFLASSVVGGRRTRSLSENYYEQPCYQAEDIVRAITWKRTSANPALAAKLLRMHFHDCFVRGRDASILLDFTKNNTAENDAIPNLSLAGYEVIDEIKTELEKECPGTVSCADILALAARDAVSFKFYHSGPTAVLWEVETGRKYGKISRDTEVLANLPSPFSNYTTLKQNFASKGLDIRDLVVLSGGHTLGIGHCNLFSNRLYNFTGTGDQDPSLNPTYASYLKTKCSSLSATSEVDIDFESTETFDSHYFVGLKQNMGMFQFDAALMTDPFARVFVDLLSNEFMFTTLFALSMQKMGAIGGDSGEIRLNCRVINS